MKIVIAGGTGQLGNILARSFTSQGNDVSVLSRHSTQMPWRIVLWDAKNPGAWSDEIDGADVVINLAGRSVDCRYNTENRRAIMDSRVHTTRAIGHAIIKAKHPPRLWLQMSTATIYAHRYDAPNDETTGIIGGTEPDVPETWRFSIDVARAWENAATEFRLDATRIVLMRTAMVMSPDAGGVFETLLRLVRFGLGGTSGNGKQFLSWIHHADFTRAVEFIIAHPNLDGAINITSPNPVPNREFMRELRSAWGVPIGLPANRLMLELGALIMQSETELILKSRRVIPARLLEAGFTFTFPNWRTAAQELCTSWRNANAK